MKNKRGRAYKMTPRRRAALAKAQAASARKRRRRAVVAGGLAAATLAVGGAVAFRRGQHRGGKPKVSGPKKPEWYTPELPTGQKKTVIPPGWGIAPLPRPRSAKTTDQTVFKTSAKGITTRTTKKRIKYDTNRRREYWQAKPVGGGTRKPYTSTKRGRR